MCIYDIFLEEGLIFLQICLALIFFNCLHPSILNTIHLYTHTYINTYYSSWQNAQKAQLPDHSSDLCLPTYILSNNLK